MLGQVVAAVIAMRDGLVWAELGAAIPHSGGGYRYVPESHRPKFLGIAAAIEAQGEARRQRKNGRQASCRPRITCCGLGGRAARELKRPHR